MTNRWGHNGNSDRIYFWGAPKSLQILTAAMISKDACCLEAMKNLDSMLKCRDVTLPTKVRLDKAIFPVVMYECELDDKQS